LSGAPLTEFCARTRIDRLKIEEDVGTDYRFRVTCSERTLTDFIGAAVHDLDYDNFKNRVASTRAGRGKTPSSRLGLTRHLPDRVADER
jgi:hypothetical protein